MPKKQKLQKGLNQKKIGKRYYNQQVFILLSVIIRLHA